MAGASILDVYPDLEEIQRRLLDWYETNRRDLPWRGETDPYRILVSEIMLQQTGVERVRGYYDRFLRQFPDFSALASAARVDILREWGGLGYNRRAIYLQECAQAVVRDHGGVLPPDPEQLARLPGIGPYTLAALLSFAFHHDIAAIDSHVRRVIGRLGFGGPASPPAVAALAERLLPRGRSSDWNQALMDFGSAQCTARQPRCWSCPMADLCVAANAESPSLRRVAEPKAPYLGSPRYYRGRIVARLRELPPHGSIALMDLARELATEIGPLPEDPAWLAKLAKGLVAHGLARLEETEGSCRIGPPI